MISLHFYLDKPNETKSSIVLSASFRGQRFKLSTKISIDNTSKNEICSKLWNPKNQRLKKSAIGSLEYNFKLDNLQARINALYIKSLKMNPKEQKKFLINQIKILLNPENGGLNNEINSDNMSLTEHFEDMINKRKAGMEISIQTGLPFGTEVNKAYQTTLNHIREFEIEQGLKLDFEDIDEVFYQDFIKFLLKKELANNTIGKHVKNLKVFMRRAVKKELTDNIKFLDYKVIDEDINSFALDMDELKKIKDLDLSSNEKLAKARDLFLIESFTCLRYKDLFNLSLEHIDLKNQTITVLVRKTKKYAVIPILPFIKTIFEKYNYKLPKMVIHTYNKLIKIIAKMAGLDDMIEIVRYSGNRRRESRYPKYQLITSTTARYSYITNCIRNNLPAQMIMQTTGHVKLENFLRYEKMVKTEGAERVRDAFKDVEF